MVLAEFFVVSDLLDALGRRPLAHFNHLAILAGHHRRVGGALLIRDLRLQESLQVRDLAYICALLHQELEGSLLILGQFQFVLCLEELFIELIGIIQGQSGLLLRRLSDVQHRRLLGLLKGLVVLCVGIPLVQY